VKPNKAEARPIGADLRETFGRALLNLEQTGASQLIFCRLPAWRQGPLLISNFFCTPAYRSRASSFIPKGPNLRNLPMGD
jgi:hypothetical protein